MKVLNLYAGIGGNRKLWPKECEVTALEIEPEIADIYQDFFPNDKVIMEDAHKYLVEHFKEFDFIWSSPPCPTHSRIRKCLVVARGQNEAVYPNMDLYQEIIFLKHYFAGKWVVENVIGYYEPLIKPQEFGGHYFWANFNIGKHKVKSRKHNAKVNDLQKRKGFDLSKYVTSIEKKKILRNCVEPELGLQIFQDAFVYPQTKLGELLEANKK
jgi:DNA (cytosine-5)-methyltransferase 1